MDDNVERGKKLKVLRKNAKLTQTEMYVELQKILDEKEGTSAAENVGYNVRQIISGLERGEGLSIRLAIAYSKFFNVSLDYIYLDKQNKKQEYEDIKELTGLSDDALNMLEKSKNDKTFMFVLNNFLGPKLSPSFINLLHSYFNYYSYNMKRNEMTNEYMKYITSKGAKIKNIDNTSWELYPKEREYTSLYKISIESNELANELKKNGGK